MIMLDEESGATQATDGKGLKWEIGEHQDGPVFSWYARFAVIAITGLGAWFRSGCLNPESLWLDDAWQAVLSHASLSDQLTFSSSSPFAFTLILGLISRLIPDPELGFQLPVFIVGVLQIPLFALLVYRITRSESVAVWGAALCAVCFSFITYAARVKQYTLDAFLVTLALLLFHRLWHNSKHIASTAAIGCCILLFSFSSSVMVAIFLNVFLVREFARERRNLVKLFRPVLSVLAYNCIAATYYLVFLRSQNNSALSRFWESCFVPWEKGPSEIASFIVNRFGVTITAFWHNDVTLWDKGGTICPGEFALLVIVACAMIFGMINYWRRELLDWYWTAAIALLYLTLVVLAGLHAFPLGGRRTDIFTVPATLLTILCGLQTCCTAQWRWGKYVAMTGAVAYTVICGFPSLLGGQPIYPQEGRSTELIQLAEEGFRDDDLMIIYPHGCFAFGYYTTMPIALEFSPEFATSFRVRVLDNRVNVLPATEGYERDPKLLGPALDGILAKATGRIIMFGAHVNQAPLDYLNDRIRRTGRDLIFGKFSGNSFVLKYSKMKTTKLDAKVVE